MLLSILARVILFAAIVVYIWIVYSCIIQPQRAKHK